MNAGLDGVKQTTNILRKNKINIRRSHSIIEKKFVKNTYFSRPVDSLKY
jgi:hypothetical protein